MGVCQTDIPCGQEIKTRIETQTIINNYENKNIIINQNKGLLNEEPRVSNEEIKITLPVRPFSSTKITRRNLRNNNFLDGNTNKKNKKSKAKSFNMTTTKTPSTQQNYNTKYNDSNEYNLNYNIKQNFNKFEIKNLSKNNLKNNLISSQKIEKKNKRSNSQVMLNCLISYSNIKNQKNNYENIIQNKNILHNVDNNIINKEYSKEKNNDNKNFSYENFQIEDIISEEKIHTKNNHEIVFRGNLLLVNNNENKMVYCVMSRIKLKLYKDITFFLKMKKPLFIIDLHLIKNIHIIKDASLGICFSLLDKYIFNSNNKNTLFKWIVILNYFSSKLSE